MISKAKYRWMILLVGVLLVSNIVLAFFLFSKNKKPDYKKMAEERSMSFYKDLGLDSIQIDSFKIAKNEFIKGMKPSWGHVKKLKDSLYHSLPHDPSDSIVISLLDGIGSQSRENERLAFSHFHRLRNLCTAEQQAKFDTLLPKFLNRNRNRR